MCGKNIAPRCPLLLSLFPHGFAPERGTGICQQRGLTDREVIEIVTYDGRDPRNEEHTALYALLAGAEGCGLLARSARLAHDEVLADFLGKAQMEIVERVGMLLAQRIALSRVFF